MESSSPTAERSMQPPQSQHLELMTVTFDKVKNSIGLSIIEAVVSCSCHVFVTVVCFIDISNLCSDISGGVQSFMFVSHVVQERF